MKYEMRTSVLDGTPKMHPPIYDHIYLEELICALGAALL